MNTITEHTADGKSKVLLIGRITGRIYTWSGCGATTRFLRDGDGAETPLILWNETLKNKCKKGRVLVVEGHFSGDPSLPGFVVHDIR
jgi:hypothetical protein